ncbi:HlyD family efflux transporter periplasmic adaptor subunit [Acaryochloris sp. IP29b_bin.148]|uniref:HlyD family secretion protein n=1 Tax=Acaryochloris sp. IP29b_bin.148 TaxID=2969218 RepID=UPI0026330B6B|nr:HlyD family efflux transporter periplasmic adaptor subunit [Acaryochloris sp. IP29b_bin.148]
MVSPSTSNPDFLPPIRTNEFLPPIENWVIFGGLSIVCVIGLALPVSSIVKYKEIVKSQAYIRPTGELRTVQSPIEGQVQTIVAKENQAVQKGDILATLKSDHWQLKQTQLNNNIQQLQLQNSQINTQLLALDRQISAEQYRIRHAVDSAQAELAYQHRMFRDKTITSTAKLKEAQANIKSEQAALQAAQDRYIRYQAVSAALSKNELEEAALGLQQQQQAVSAAKATLQATFAALNPSEAEMAMAKEKILQENAIGQAALSKLMQEKQALGQQRTEINKQLHQNRAELQQVRLNLNQTKIAATANGIIAQLNLRNPGQTIGPGVEIAQIAPDDVPLEVQATVSPPDISKVKLGQSVSMRISACAYPDYGTLTGTVSQISKDTTKPTQKRSNSNPRVEENSTAPAFYKVMIKPNQTYLKQGKNRCQIGLGMEGRADIVTREETVFNFFLRKARLMADI